MKVLVFKHGFVHNRVLISNVLFDASKPYPLLINFDYNKVIGSARFERDENADIWANIDVNQDFEETHKGLTTWPAIGCHREKKDHYEWRMDCVSLCPNRNADEEIGSITL